MTANPVLKYNTADIEVFVKRTRRRIMFEVFALLLLGLFFLSSWSKGLPNWLEFSVLMLFSANILLDLVYYPKAKAISAGFYICLLDNYLGFPVQDHMRQIPYSDLKISKTITKNDKIIGIYLKTTFDQTIKLQGLENMEELYENLRIKGVSE